jgi:hypothetical protein
VFEGGENEWKEYVKLPVTKTKLWVLGRTHLQETILPTPAGCNFEHRPAPDCLQPALCSGFRQQVRPGVRCQEKRRTESAC